VLGQSRNAGWEASVDGGTASDPVLADGFGNGWYVEPDGGPLHVTLRWAPQRAVDVALVLSAVALVGCLALAVLAGRRRVSVPLSGGRGPIAPELRTAVSTARRPRARTAVAAAALCGVVAAVVVDPLVGLGTFAVALGALRFDRLARLPAVGAVAALGAAAAYVVLKQYRNDYPPDFGWPDFFDAAHWLGWVAVVLLAVDAVVDVLRDRSRPTTGE
jgi:hypothetical protein